MKPQRQTSATPDGTSSTPAALPLKGRISAAIALTAEPSWAAEVDNIQIGVEEAVIYNSGPDDPLDPDEPIREVVHLSHHGGIVIILTDHHLYVMDQATFQASACAKRQRGM